MKLLFVCSRNRLRSPTAEAVFSSYPGIEFMSAGTNKDAETPVSAELIEWADGILVMERTHQRYSIFGIGVDPVLDEVSNQRRRTVGLLVRTGSLD
jgi:protein-tyrosine-phosphatase